jgi:hypothetical protein
MTQSTNTDLNECIADSLADLSQFLGILHKRFGSQLAYDIQTNLPSGRVERGSLASHAVRVALVAAIGEYLNWDTEQVCRFAAQALEDSNIHYLAKLIYDQLGNYGNDEELSS